jgi:hypothetical protein
VETVCYLKQCDSRLLIHPEEHRQLAHTKHYLIYVNSSLNPLV